jgi:GH25 family lysozyme M1 (1,4-beta-N-acetylmuramidase)
MRALGVDLDESLIIHPDGFPKMRQAGVSFAYIRLGEAATRDSDFDDFWRRAGEVGLLRGAYYAWAPAINRRGAGAWNEIQIQWVKDHAPTDAELPLAIDMEVGEGNLTDIIHKFVGALKTVFKHVVIYTRTDLWNDHIRPQPWVGSYDFWMAAWPPPNKDTDPKVTLTDWIQIEPRVPRDNRWTDTVMNGPRAKFWQWTGEFYRLPGFGHKVIVDGHEAIQGALLDIDLFDGTLNDLRAWAGLPPAAEDDPGFRLASSETSPETPTPVVTPPAPPATGETTPPDAVLAFRTGRVTAQMGLFVRDGPGSEFNQIASFNFGDMVHIRQEKDGWGKLDGADGWIDLEFVELQPTQLGEVDAPLGLIVRSGPGTEFDRIASHNFGEALEIGEEVNGWGKLVKEEGWVSLEFIAFNG